MANDGAGVQSWWRDKAAARRARLLPLLIHQHSRHSSQPAGPSSNPISGQRSCCKPRWLVNVDRHQTASGFMSPLLPTSQSFICSPSCCPLRALPLHPHLPPLLLHTLPEGHIPFLMLCREPADDSLGSRLLPSPLTEAMSTLQGVGIWS